jgi:hypothetical protein
MYIYSLFFTVLSRCGLWRAQAFLQYRRYIQYGLYK